MSRRRRVLLTVVGLIIVIILMTGILTLLSPDRGAMVTFGAVVDDERLSDSGGLEENLTAVPYSPENQTGGGDSIPEAEDENDGGSSGGGGSPEQGDATAEIDDGDFVLDLTNINPSSETEIPRLFEVEYDGDEEVEIWVEAVNQESYPGEVWFFSTEPEHVRFDEERLTLEGGESAVVGVYVSSFDTGAGDVLLEEIRIHAEPVNDGFVGIEPLRYFR